MGTYSEWHFEDWMEVFEDYEDGLCFDEWIKSNIGLLLIERLKEKDVIISDNLLKKCMKKFKNMIGDLCLVEVVYEYNSLRH